jgi:hypothetical protein
MEAKTKTKTGQILMAMKILAWVAFVGFMIEAGAILFSYFVSCINPEGAKNLYNGMNLYALRKADFWHYTLHVTFMIVVSVLKSFVWLKVIKMVSELNLANPFKLEIANILEEISYVLFGIWLFALLNSVHSVLLLKITGENYGSVFSGDFLFAAGLVFIIAHIFKKGVEIQSENELTV